MLHGVKQVTIFSKCRLLIVYRRNSNIKNNVSIHSHNIPTIILIKLKTTYVMLPTYADRRQKWKTAIYNFSISIL